MENPHYAHKELMEQLNLQTKDLPEEIKEHAIKFHQKSRFAKKPQMIQDLIEYSEIIADDIHDWHTHMALSSTEEPEMEEEETEVEEEPQVEEIQPISEVVEKEITQESKEEIQPIDEVVEKETPIETSVEKEEENSGWGINLDW
jgi:hypothetical protein